MEKTLFLIISLALMLTVSSCANSHEINTCLDTTNQSGFWAGTWHGMITFFSFIGSLFNDKIAVYDVNNNGGWYDFGFVGGFFFILRILGRIIVS